MTRASLLALLLAACTAHTTTVVATPPTAPMGPRALHKGQALDGTLHLGETHVFTIDLQPGEPLHLDVSGASGPNDAHHGCGNWGYEWHQPEGATVTSNPLPLAPHEDGSGTRTAALDLDAKVADAGDMAPHGGTWAFHLTADPANCAEIRYHLAAR